MINTSRSGVVAPLRALPPTTPRTPLLNKFTAEVTQAKWPDAILDALDDFASRLLPVHVLGVGQMPRRTSDWRSIQLGKDVFLHRSAPVEWWNEYAAKAAQGYDPGIMMAKTSLVAYTWTETMQKLEPVGIDRWPYELARKYGIRDALTCCVGQRWLVAYWSNQVLCNLLTHPLRILLIAAAAFAALRFRTSDRGPQTVCRSASHNASGTCRFAVGLIGDGRQRNGQTAWYRPGDCAQPSQEGAKQARRSQPLTRGGGSNPAAAHPLSCDLLAMQRTTAS